MTMYSPETHYDSGSRGYKIMVSLGMRVSPETCFWNRKFPAYVFPCLVSLRCWTVAVQTLKCQLCALVVTPFKSAKVTVVMDIQM